MAYKGDPKYAPGQVVNGKVICGAKKKNGEPDKSPPIKGGDRCWRHGGKAPQTKRLADARVILGQIDPDAPREHPIEMILNIIQAKYAEREWLRSKVRELKEEELVWGLAQHETGVGPEGPIDKQTFKADLNAWYKLLNEVEDQIVKWSSMALKAGIEERTLALQERQAAQVADVINRILSAMQLTPDQRALIPQVVPPILRSISG
ncbi:hypothetical protein [Arthrobacter sp. VKM Ac-2550]|uniref:hypothetical protein n=1 Tax=Crystallibacter permensis TaxID=1938888 RepID=UPI002225D5B6|nr:hypothetical protein [Arthrobacter sp. VKM Ac-2550]MCW2132905.1 hypothetical protein [Arthrobacter sp. VKM Ac-2550]